MIFLMGAMLDLTAPQATESAEERVNRAVREAHEAATRRAIQRATGRRI